MKKIKKMSCICIILLFTCLGTACLKKDKMQIIGYWMRGDGYTISFSDEQFCSLGGSAPEEYKIYDENHLQIIGENGVIEFVFKIEGDSLWLGLAEEIEPTAEFTRDPEKQKAILEEIAAMQKEEEERQTIENAITSFQERIIDAEEIIKSNNKSIEKKESSIEYYERLIESYYELCESAIELGNDREEEEQLRDELISEDEKVIEEYKKEIEELKKNNVEIEKEIEILKESLLELQNN